MVKVKDISGQKFGRLTAIERVGTKHGCSLWKCKCECGETVTVYLSNLTSEKTKSCGCLQKELARKQNTTHNLLKKDGKPTRLYKIWRGMRSRCYNQNLSNYKYYGERGIKVCKEWRNSYKEFYQWAQANGYQDNLTIDRIDNNGNYCPENCHWANRAEQSLNKSSNHILTFKGKAQTIKEWADELNIKYGTLRTRVDAYNWSTEKALTTPVEGG